MMLPATTVWPPKTLTPSRFDSESRPFLLLPPAFLCATLLHLEVSGPTPDASGPLPDLKLARLVARARPTGDHRPVDVSRRRFYSLDALVLAFFLEVLPAAFLVEDEPDAFL